MVDFIFWIMGTAFLFFTVYFAHNNNFSEKVIGILIIIELIMIIIIKNALGIDY